MIAHRPLLREAFLLLHRSIHTAHSVASEHERATAGRDQLPAFSAATRARQEHRKCHHAPPKLSKERRITGDLVIIKGNWAGYGHNRGMQRAAGGFPRKTLERRVETSLVAQRAQQGHKTYIGVQDEYGTSKRHSKLPYALNEIRLDKFNPRKDMEATTIRANGTVRTFTVAKDRPHKLLAWWRKLADGTKRLIVTNRDEPTCVNFLIIYVRAFLGLDRPLHLSRMGTFLAPVGRQPATPVSPGRGLCGSERSTCKCITPSPHFIPSHRT